eukprot:gnl/TRDRNA2_/TRDRNA2_155536_c0_seq3.p1 gnl/TRDRNA2_/TRDRNA2_155536_c0~~gnl/TRDRNA2_/TRDRNA2_155536_c0_seq3.p1  ORF type:complete len:115 (-),score=18.14 gnl/TRDRNA2_/TRDRNA2_155536_c0_seq3:396-740(-)
MSMAGLLSFWSAFTIIMGLGILNAITGGIMMYIVMMVVCTMYRQQIRTKFGIEHDEKHIYVYDFLSYAFCFCCAIAQDARQIEAAAIAGHDDFERPKSWSSETRSMSRESSVHG